MPWRSDGKKVEVDDARRGRLGSWGRGVDAAALDGVEAAADDAHDPRDEDPDDRSDAEWRGRPWLARTARLTILAVPFGIVILMAWQVNQALGPPVTVLEAVARWAALSVVSTIALVAIDRGARRLLPLSTLLQLSIVFPDQAPSRFKLALRQGSAKHLAREVSSLEHATAQEAAEFLLTVVGQLTMHDRLTRGHTERVRAYADVVAVEMGLTEEERMKLQWAGLIHDIGKLSVPTDVLNKSTELTEREWSRLKTHPDEGWKMVQPMRGWLGEWARATRDHHERWDGLGYPRGLKGTEISRAGRIIAVVDAFDVMTTVRAYKTAMSHDKARAELANCAGTQFDPEVVRAFLAVSVLPQRRRRLGTWLANSPVALQATSVAQVPAAVTSAAAAALAAITIVAPAIEADRAQPAAERIVDEIVAPPAPLTLPSSSAPRRTTTTTTSTTTTSTTTTTAPTTTTTAASRPVAPPAPAPPAAPSPTTTTTSTTTTTTTTLAPSTFAGGFLGAGSGGSTFGLVSTVGGSGAINWDPANNADPGFTLTSGTAGLAEIDEPHVTAWSLPIGQDTRLVGSASLRLYLAAPAFDPATVAGVSAGLIDCTNATTGCTTISAGGAVFAQKDFGTDFGVVTIDLGSIDHTLAAGHTLLVSMTVPQSMSGNTWLAFGTSTYPSQFRLV